MNPYAMGAGAVGHHTKQIFLSSQLCNGWHDEKKVATNSKKATAARRDGKVEISERDKEKSGREAER